MRMFSILPHNRECGVKLTVRSVVCHELSPPIQVASVSADAMMPRVARGRVKRAGSSPSSQHMTSRLFAHCQYHAKESSSTR